MPHLIAMSDIRSCLPSNLLSLLEETTGKGTKLYLTGGTVRDILLGRGTKDIDFAVSRDALSLARKFAEVAQGTFVLLDEQEKVARVVFKNHQVDFAEFRKDSKSLEEDLWLRDLTVNALAVCLSPGSDGYLPLIDPTGGYRDLENRIIRFVSEQSIVDDPLRMLRAYRFAASLDFSIESLSRKLVRKNCTLIERSSGERTNYEMMELFSVENSYPVLQWMAEDGLLLKIAPELADLRQIAQNGYHGLDVYAHSLLTFSYLEKILANPAEYFPKKHIGILDSNLRHGTKPVLLKWAALFHDVGKPKTAEKKAEKITFYNHDQVGTAIFWDFAQRLRWSSKDARFLEKMIALHMRPFHLTNVMRSGELTPRAISRLLREAGDDIIALFVLAMSDSLAGVGPTKPHDCEELLLELFDKLMLFYEEHLKLRSLPRLVTGKDLIDIFHLEPGPRFRTLLDELESVRLEGQVSTRDDALSWIEERVKEGFNA